VRRYLPLQLEGDVFVSRDSPFSDLEWNNHDFVASFALALQRMATVMSARVRLDGAEFEDRVIYRIGDTDEYYILVDERSVPLEIWKTNVSERGARDPARSPGKPSRMGFEDLFNKVSRSDEYYQNLRVLLATEWVAPRCSIEGREDQIFHSTELLIHPFVILMGPPGAGKTSLVRRLAYDCAANNSRRPNRYPTPVYVSLRSFQTKLRSLTSEVLEQEESFGLDFIAPRRFEGGLLYIFDGLDELDIEAREDFRKWLSDFMSSKPSLRVIVTSREFKPADIPEFKDFKVVQMLPFGRAQQFEYCHKFLSRAGTADQFIKVLEANPTTEEFLTNPLSLSLALALFAIRGLMPFNVGEIVQEIVSQLTEGWDLRRGIRRYRHLNAPTVKSILGRLAAKLQTSGGGTFSGIVVLDVVPAALSDISIEEILGEIRDATGLLAKDGDNWSFTHKYFQDFFCAMHLTERTMGLEKELGSYAGDSRWDGVWAQISDLCAEPEQFAAELAARTASGPKALSWTSSSLLSSRGITVDAEKRLSSLLNEEVRRLLNQVELVQDGNKLRILPRRNSAVGIEDLLSMVKTVQNLRFARRDEVFLSLIRDDFVRSFFMRLTEMLDAGAKPSPTDEADGITMLDE